MQYYSQSENPIFPSPGLKSLREFIILKVCEFGEFLLYTSLFLGAAATGMAYASSFIQGIGWTIPLGVVMFLIVFSVYNMNRKTDEAEDALNHERRFHITKKFEQPLFYASYIAYTLALVIAAFHGITALTVATIPLVSGIFYSIPFLPGKWGYHRLKEIPVVKNIVVSIAWALAFSLLPVYLNGSVPGPAAFIVFLFIFSWTFVGSVLPDIRDMRGDSATGVSTIPVLIGIPKSRYLLTTINILSGAIILTIGRSMLPLVVNLVIACSLAYSQACIIAIGCTSRNDLLCDVISDGQFLVIGGICFFVVSVFALLPGSTFLLQSH